MKIWGDPFIGSSASAAGTVTRHQLQTRYRRLFPDVYVEKEARLTLEQRILGAWLWSQRRATVGGLAAAGLHGSKWIGADIAVELVHGHVRPPAGIITRRDALFDDEVMMLDGCAVTTPERTAFDLGRRGSIMSTVPRLDALVNATGIKLDDVAQLADRHPGVRGLRNLETMLALVDGGAQSLKESEVRLWLIEAGFPPPRTQIPVLGSNGMPFAFIDLGWEDWTVGVEYEGEHHFVDRVSIASGVHRLEKVQELWGLVRLTAADTRASTIQRVHRAVLSRGFMCPCPLSNY